GSGDGLEPDQERMEGRRPLAARPIPKEVFRAVRRMAHVRADQDQAAHAEMDGQVDRLVGRVHAGPQARRVEFEAGLARVTQNRDADWRGTEVDGILQAAETGEAVMADPE